MKTIIAFFLLMFAKRVSMTLMKEGCKPLTIVVYSTVTFKGDKVNAIKFPNGRIEYIREFFFNIYFQFKKEGTVTYKILKGDF